MSIGADIIRGQATHSFGDTERVGRVNVMTDSRQRVEDGLFIPLVGERFNGHRFLHQAILNGAVAAVWADREPLPADVPDGFPIFFVRDTLKTLQSMAKSYLNHVLPKIVAVTGSNGKTTTKDMIFSILKHKFRTYKTQGNFNNHIGVPLTILSMPEDTEVLVLEMGMNHFGELTFLSQLARPDIAIITNIGESHIEYLGSRAGIARAKLEIIQGLKKRGVLIIDGDEPLLADIKSYDFRIVRCGYSPGNDWQVTGVTETVDGNNFSLNGGNEQFHVPVLGRHNVKNAVYGAAAARILGADESVIRDGLQHLRLTRLRFEKIPGLMGSLIINDCYNASPTSMKASITALKKLPGFSCRVAVLGDMYELGRDEVTMHKSVACVLTPPLTHVVTIGDKGAWIADGMREKEGGRDLVVRTFLTKADALPYLKSLLNKNTVMLFKASRLLALEELSDALSEK